MVPSVCDCNDKKQKQRIGDTVDSFVQWLFHWKLRNKNVKRRWFVRMLCSVRAWLNFQDLIQKVSLFISQAIALGIV